MNKKFAMSYSGGKDSTLALYRMIKKGYEPKILLTTLNEKDEHSWFHGISDNLFNSLSECLNIPHYSIRTNQMTYRINFVEKLKELKNEEINVCAFGDIDIEMHRDWAEKLCHECLLKAVFPLWQESRVSLAREFVESGFKAKIKIVDITKVDKKYIGAEFNNELIDEFISLGIDPAGESGEFHTLVYDGPIFKKPLNIELKEIIDLYNHSSVNIEIKS